MATEEYSVGYDAGYQDGWNAAMDKTPQRTWVGLTDEERTQLWNDRENGHVVEATEAKLKEKNNDTWRRW